MGFYGFYGGNGKSQTNYRGLSVMIVSHAKTAELIEMPFEYELRLAQGSMC